MHFGEAIEGWPRLRQPDKRLIEVQELIQIQQHPAQINPSDRFWIFRLAFAKQPRRQLNHVSASPLIFSRSFGDKIERLATLSLARPSP